MIAGVIFAHYFFIIVEKYSYIFDTHVLGIPLEKRLATHAQMKAAKNREIESMQKRTGDFEGEDKKNQMARKKEAIDSYESRNMKLNFMQC